MHPARHEALAVGKNDVLVAAARQFEVRAVRGFSLSEQFQRIHKTSACRKYSGCFSLQFVEGDLTATVRLEMQVKPVELLHAIFARSICLYRGAEFLEVYADPIQSET